MRNQKRCTFKQPKVLDLVFGVRSGNDKSRRLEFIYLPFNGIIFFFLVIFSYVRMFFFVDFFYD